MGAGLEVGVAGQQLLHALSLVHVQLILGPDGPPRRAQAEGWGRERSG